MKILLTGATGFLGSHLAKAFVNSGYEVHALIRKSSIKKRLNDCNKSLIYHYLEDGLQCAFSNGLSYDAVVHTATCYGREGESNLEIFDTNTRLPLRILELSSLSGTKIFVNSDTVLPESINAYALSKKQLVEWGRRLSKTHDMNFLNIKLEHIYGPGDDKKKFTAYIIRSCMENIPVIKMTAGEQKRDFIYIDDVVKAYTLLLANIHKQSFNEVHLGTGITISIREFVETVHKITQSKSILDFGAYPYRDNEIMISTSGKNELEKYGWKPEHDLVQAIKNIIAYEK